MKRTIFILSILAALAACSSDDGRSDEATPVVLQLQSRTPIETRADITLRQGDRFLVGDQIGLYGYCDTWNTSGTNYQNASLTLTLGSSTYYNTGRYWPGNTEKVSFIGYYPQGGTGITTTGSITAAALPTIGFTMQPITANQVDLLVSDCQSLPLNETTNRDGIIPLTFYHALSQIRFYVLLDLEPGSQWHTVNSKGEMRVDVALSGIYTTGTLTLSTTPSATLGGHTWGAIATPGTSTATAIHWMSVDAATLTTFNPNNYVIQDADKMLLLPYTYAAGSLPTMTLTLTDTSASSPITPSTYTATLIANSDSDADGTDDELKWRAGYIYNYYFVLRPGIWGYFLNPHLEAEQW